VNTSNFQQNQQARNFFIEVQGENQEKMKMQIPSAAACRNICLKSYPIKSTISLETTSFNTQLGIF
jgi:hypothetical protein